MHGQKGPNPMLIQHAEILLRNEFLSGKGPDDREPLF